MTTVASQTVGTDIASMCTKCRIEREHTVASRVGEKLGKVRCKTCGSLHRYIKPGTPVPAPRRKTSKVTTEETWSRRLESASTKQRTVYTPAGAYQIDDVIDHSHFGVGIVTMLTAKDKMQVTFKDGPKILIMGMRPAV
jgi:hypothetical protein